MCYPHIPPLFYHYHYLLELQKHRLWGLLSYLISLSSSSPSLGPYPTTTKTLTLENLNLIQRILELTHSRSITAFYHTSFNRIANLSLAPSSFWTPAMMPFTPHHETPPFKFQFRLRQGKHSNFHSQKTSTTSSLFIVSFIHLTFHVPKRLT